MLTAIYTPGMCTQSHCLQLSSSSSYEQDAETERNIPALIIVSAENVGVNHICVSLNVSSEGILY